MNQKQELLDVLKKEDEKITFILDLQKTVYDCVKTKNWISLQPAMEKINAFENDFLELEKKREVLLENKNLNLRDKEVSEMMFSVRSKLVKSKVENEALNSYVSTSVKFAQEILDECVPQQKNVLYTKKGLLRKPPLQSILLNQSL